MEEQSNDEDDDLLSDYDEDKVTNNEIVIHYSELNKEVSDMMCNIFGEDERGFSNQYTCDYNNVNMNVNFRKILFL